MKYSWIILTYILLLGIEELHAFKLKKNCTLLPRSAAKKEICMRDLGCFQITSDFVNDKKRPFNVLPKDRRIINTQFLLFTRNNPNKSYDLVSDDEKSLKNAPLDTSVTTIFIVHGFLDMQYFVSWMNILKDEILKNSNYNVIIVDWSGGNQLPYTQATANTRVVGAEIAFLIGKMKRVVGLHPQSCHIVGHSLGAHIAGYAGERLEHLGRITALDPAAPYFEGMPTSVRIDPSDAKFVDAIHTDLNSFVISGLGMSDPVGHVDFYPNNGRDQPGCKTSHRLISIITDGFIEGIRKAVSCSHQRAVDFFTASINQRDCLFTAFPCSNWTDFTEGKCSTCGPYGRDCAVMGFLAEEHKPANLLNTTFFLKTQDHEPFCVYHYQVDIYLQDGEDKELEGKIKLILGHDFGEEVTVNFNEKYIRLVPGTTITSLIISPYELHLPETITFYWVSSAFAFWNTHTLGVDKVKITPMDLMDQITQDSLIKIYYPKSNTLNEMKNIEMYLED
ncbi:pancreatic lipase-related protein 2-like isoform X1 [Centruroides sculpturatus]|uniref:pancreatic lipase-related protein 2-like isoform X1 n=2 Tax=Centruroides sculpturatus TaxID=218467 RepID=UPI000C6DCECF|nr:pancreatic lipase-related protein 2-like isoform X1 [Centruroides sculpturatus]XP_023229614.1 pancreatic lipase-related protein 2-like isoform X1 [Centruroides sculpturatus]